MDWWYFFHPFFPPTYVLSWRGAGVGGDQTTFCTRNRAPDVVTLTSRSMHSTHPWLAASHASMPARASWHASAKLLVTYSTTFSRMWPFSKLLEQNICPPLFARPLAKRPCAQLPAFVGALFIPQNTQKVNGRLTFFFN